MLLDFTEDRLQKPFTVEAKIAYGIVTSVTWDETPLPERKAGPYSSIIWYNHEFHDEVECGLCANQGQGSWISAGTALCAQCWGEVMAVMTHAYNEEDLQLAQGEMGIGRPLWDSYSTSSKPDTPGGVLARTEGGYYNQPSTMQIEVDDTLRKRTLHGSLLRHLCYSSKSIQLAASRRERMGTGRSSTIRPPALRKDTPSSRIIRNNFLIPSLLYTETSMR